MLKYRPGQVVNPDGEPAATGQVLGSQEAERQGSQSAQGGGQHRLEDRDEHLLDDGLQDAGREIDRHKILDQAAKV